VEAAETQDARARKNISDAVVTAQISGYVANRPTYFGGHMTTSFTVETIVCTNSLRVRIEITEQMLSIIRVHQSASISVSAYPDRSFSSRIARISSNVTASSRTMTVEAEVEDGNNLLKPGQVTTLRVLQPQSDPAVLVRARAIRTEAGASRLFGIKNGRAVQRLVQL